MKKTITLKAFYKSCDTNNKKLSMLFLDDEIEPFTKNFLMKYYSNAQNNPIRGNEFYVKYNDRSICCLDKSETCVGSISDLVDSIVIMRVNIKNYNFANSDGRKVIGWNIVLDRIHPS